jgi:hypothetical protein
MSKTTVLALSQRSTILRPSAFRPISNKEEESYFDEIRPREQQRKSTVGMVPAGTKISKCINEKNGVLSIVNQ